MDIDRFRSPPRLGGQGPGGAERFRNTKQPLGTSIELEVWRAVGATTANLVFVVHCGSFQRNNIVKKRLRIFSLLTWMS